MNTPLTANAAGATLNMSSLTDQKGLFTLATLTFTAPYACYVKVSFDATINNTSSGPVNKGVIYNEGDVSQTQDAAPGAGYQSSAGMHLV